MKGAAEYNSGKGSADDVAIETPDDKTLKVTLLAPAPYWLGLTSFFTYLPQNQKFVESKGDKYALSPDALLYNGPYKLTEFNPTSGVVVVKNEDYWNADNVEISKVDAKIVKETDTAVNLYESGQLDETIIDSEFVTEYKGTPDLVTHNAVRHGLAATELRRPALPEREHPQGYPDGDQPGCRERQDPQQRFGARDRSGPSRDRRPRQARPSARPKDR